jgi:3-oxoacyl-[acyl-carrier-protein] synthase II
VVITGIGAATPIGVGKECVWDHFCAGTSGVAPIRLMNWEALPARIAGEVKDFDPRAYVKQRKTLKVMSRDSQLAVAAAALACRDAEIEDGAIDPERFGVVLGADRICNSLEDSDLIYRPCMADGRFDFSRWGTEGMASGFPLCFLKVLPNMSACHISINQDARGPNNTIHQCDTSSLQAVIEAARVIQRGMADVMIAGGASSTMNPFDWAARGASGRLSPRSDPPPDVMRPFDALRDGEVAAEGAAVFILESSRHARARKARILARILGGASAAEPTRNSPPPFAQAATPMGTGLQRAMRLAMAEAGLRPEQIGHVNAQGASLALEDRIEARAIRACLPDVPVTAPRSYFGNAGAAAGALELIASVMAVGEGRIPPTLNYQRPDPQCPIPVIHGKPQVTTLRTALAINWTSLGQATALVLAGPE